MGTMHRNRLPQLYKRKQMTPQLTTVYVPVDVKDELPTEGKFHSVSMNGGLTFDYSAMGKNWKPEELGYTHWLNPITGYFLTPEEMEEVKREAREQAIREAAEGFVINPGSFGEGEYKPPFIEQESILNLLK